MQCINTIVESVYCAFYSLHLLYQYLALPRLMSSIVLSGILSQVEDYCRAPWHCMEATTWLGAVAARNTPILLSQLANYNSCWEAVLVNMWLTEGSFQPMLTVLPAIAGLVGQAVSLVVIEVLIGNHACLAVGLYLLHVYMIMMMLSRPYVRYRPKRERGMLPYIRWGRDTTNLFSFKCERFPMPKDHFFESRDL